MAVSQFEAVLNRLESVAERLEKALKWRGESMHAGNVMQDVNESII